MPMTILLRLFLVARSTRTIELGYDANGHHCSLSQDLSQQSGSTQEDGWGNGKQCLFVLSNEDA